MTPFWIAGAPVNGSDAVGVRSPYDGRPVGTTTVPTADHVEAAVEAAAGCAGAFSALPAADRAMALDQVSATIAARAGEFAALISAESGKPIRWARIEVSRAVSTFRWAAEEARRFAGDLMRLDTEPASAGRLALIRRFPRGPVLGITPFNFPLNLVAHKVAPALAVGAPVIVKPAPATPLTALLLGEVLAQTPLPAGSWSILPLPNPQTAELVTDPRLPVVSFTGSGPVGARIRSAVPAKHVTLELGGNAAAIVCGDYTDLDGAARRIALFGNYQAGQSCIAVQRVIAHERVAADFTDLLVDHVRALVTGDPSDEATQVGPLIDTTAATRVEQWVKEAVTSGATLRCGGVRDDSAYEPTVLTGVPSHAKIACEEVFGPVLVVSVVRSDDEAFAVANDSAFGLQAGVFTHDVRTAFHAHRVLQVGGVIVGDVPSYRADQMPYGGTKASGVGREGVRAAMDDYTEPRVLVLTGVDL